MKMKKILITAMVSILPFGTVSADYATDVNSDIANHGSQPLLSADLTRLPATAAGRANEENYQEYQERGVVDGPDYLFWLDK
jgi:hypothetical protein